MFFLGRCSQASAISTPALSSPRSFLQGSPAFTSPTRQPWTRHKLSWSSFFSGFPRVHPCKSCTSVQRSILLTIILLPIISISSRMKERVKRTIVMCASCRHCSLIVSHYHHHHHDRITTRWRGSSTSTFPSSCSSKLRELFEVLSLLIAAHCSHQQRWCWFDIFHGGWQRCKGRGYQW